MSIHYYKINLEIENVLKCRHKGVEKGETITGINVRKLHHQSSLDQSKNSPSINRAKTVEYNANRNKHNEED